MKKLSTLSLALLLLGSATAQTTYNSDTTITTLVNVSGTIVTNSATLTITGATGELRNGIGTVYIGGNHLAAGTGDLLLSAGGILRSGAGTLGRLAGSTGDALITGSDSHWQVSGALYVGSSGTGSLTLSDGGKVTVSSVTHVALGATGTGTLNLGAAAGDAAMASGILNTDEIRGGSGTGVLQVNTTGTTAAPTYLSKDGTATGAGVALAGTLSLVHTAGTTLYKGAQIHTGGTTLNGGTAIFESSVSHGISVQSGATLGGTSLLHSALLASGARLAPGSIVDGAFTAGTLTFAGAGLTLQSGSILDFQLGTTSDKLRISAGTLAGPESGHVTINLTDSGGFAAATYQLFDFSGATLDDFDVNDFTLGTVIAGYDYSFELSGTTLSLVATASAIPEPSTYAALFGSAALGWALVRRRRQAAKPSAQAPASAA